MNATDLETLRAFYLGSRQQLYTYAVSLTRNREVAEDAIHGVFEKLLRGPALPADLRPYVFRAVRHAALDGWRHSKVRTDSLFTAATALQPAELSLPGRTGADDLDALLRCLPADERETIVLKIYGDLTFQEIATLRQVPLPTVASWHRRGLERLRNMLAPES